jgi:acyl-CoA ligase (AMP-forming) (exosortase A-associated)
MNTGGKQTDALLHHLLRGSAARFPNKEAIVHGNRRMTYAETWRAVTSLAGLFRAEGLEHGDRLGVFLNPSIPQALSIFAASAADAVFVPIHHSLFPEQVAHILSDCGATGLITTKARLAGLSEVMRRIPSLRVLLAVDLDAPFPLDGPALKEKCHGTDLAAILYTSGSTGRPKGVMLSHAQIVAGAEIVSSYLGITRNDRILAALPFSFDAGLNQIMTAFQQAATIVLLNFTFAREIVDALVSESITGLGGVPTLWTLLAHPSSTLHRKQLTHLRYITNTGGVMPQTVLASLRKALPGTSIFLMYGFTEAFRSTYLSPEDLGRRPSSIGKAIPHTEIQILNEDGKPCAPGEIGELVHRGPTVALGYWGKPELTNEVFRPHPSGEKVCYSGDLVKSDDEGFIYYVGRRDALIKSSGFRISPTEIEEILCRNASVRSAAVIGIPDELLGHRIKAFVVRNDSDDRCVAEALISFCAERLPRYMVPQTIEFLDDLPTTANGKVDYSALRFHDAQL